MILAQPVHTFKSDDEFVAAQVEGDTLVIAKTRSEEHASEGNYLNLVTVMPLVEAVALAKAILAAAQQADEDAWIDAQYERHLDREFMFDCAVEHGSGYTSGVYRPSLQ